MHTSSSLLRPGSLALALFAACTTSLLSGCAGFSPAVAPMATLGVSIQGAIHGGQQPVSGSRVYLLAVNTTAYGGASSSVLSTSGTGVQVDASGLAYVTSDSNGNFTMTGAYTCPVANPLIYLIAAGGNPGLAAGTNNTALSLMSALGSCNSVTAATQVNINEVSTVAAVTALQPFMVDEYKVGAPAGNTLGIATAFNNAQNLVVQSTGLARSVTVAGNGFVPQAKINTLADTLAPCINSTGAASTPCKNLLTATTITGSTAPNTTVKAMLSIAQNPGTNVLTIYNQANAAAPFQPTLASAPNDLALAITYTGGGLTSPGLVVIDTNGAAWTANCPTCNNIVGTDSIVAFSAQGVVLTGANGYTTNIHKPQGLAFDTNGNLWSVNDATTSIPDQVVKMNAAGTVAAGFPFSSANLGTPLGIALDGSGNAWVTNQSLSNVLNISSTGSQIGVPITNGAFSTPIGIGLDSAGNVYAAGASSSNILKVQITPPATTLLTGGGLSAPQGIAVDGPGKVWTLNNQSNTLSILDGPSGTAVTSGVGVSATQAVITALDGSDTSWTANCRASCPGSGSNSADNLLHFDFLGVSRVSSDGLQDSHLSAAGTAAVDASGNVWVSNNTGGSLTEFIGVASPVVTPLAVGVLNHTLATRP